MRTLQNQHGFSLVQVMIAVGLMGGLALAMMQLTDQQFKTQKTLEMNAEINEVAQIFRQTIADKAACENTFKILKPGQSTDEIRLNDDESIPPFAKVGENFRNGNLWIKDIYLMTRDEIKDLQKGDFESSYDPTTGKGYTVVKVTFVKGKIESKKANHYGGKEVVRYFSLKGVFGDEIIFYEKDFDAAKAYCEQEANASSAKFNDPETLKDDDGNDIHHPTDPTKTQFRCLLLKDDFGISSCETA